MAEALYRLGEEIGRGALGRVLEVTRDDGTRFAGKILHAHEDAKAMGRFAAEADVLRNLRHPNVVQIYGMEDIEGYRVMLMELVAGPSLSKLLAHKKTLTTEEILPIAMGTAAGLRVAHHAGIVHRDLKPQNILLTPEHEPKIADFGLARATSFDGVDASAFAVVGTPDYMAPECVDPLAIDPRSDLYALGCILFELATGLPPFRGPTSIAVLQAHRDAEIPKMDGANISDDLKTIIASLLAKSMADRIPSAQAVFERLTEIRTGKALVPRGAICTALANSVQCIACSQPLLTAVPVCFSCGQMQISAKPGSSTLVVLGPGEVGDKLDKQLRQSLLHWIDANPGLNLNTKSLAKTIPRLPFVLCTKIDRATAQAMAIGLESIGLATTVQTGTVFSLAAMRKKSVLLAGRVALVSLASYSYFLVFNGGLGFLTLGAIGVAASAGSGIYRARRSVTKTTTQLASDYDPAVQRALLGVAPVLANMQRPQHRESLRAVIERALACPLEDKHEELASLIDMSVLAAARMDAIEVEVSATDLRNPSPHALELLRERDILANRLLEITAFLDSIQARSASLKAADGDSVARTNADLDDLRQHIAALEEVQSL